MPHPRTMLFLAGLVCCATPATTVADPPVAALSEPNTGRIIEHPAPPARRTFTRADIAALLLADPAIRAQLLEMAENSYDFTDPNGVPGFGPIEPNSR